MTPLSPNSPHAPLRSAGFRKLAPPGLSADKVEVGHSVPQVDLMNMPRVEAKPVKRSLMGQMLRWGGLAGMAAAAGTGVVGGIAYNANKEVLQQPHTVHIYPQKINAPAQKPADPVQLLRQGPAPRVLTQQAGPMQVFVPSDTLTNFLHEVRETPKFKSMIAEKAAHAKATLEKSLETVKVPDSQVLLDADMPLPTSERPLLQVGSVNLPSFGMRALKTEKIPLSLAYTTQPIHTGLNVDVQMLDPDPAVKGPGVLLGAVQVTLTAPDGKIPVQGHLDLHLDKDGQATRAQIEKLRQLPGQGELIQQLEARLAQNQRLEKLGQEHGFSDVLQKGFQHDGDFQAEVVTGTGPLARTTLYVWATPDRTGDSKADIQVTQVSDVDGLEHIKLDLTRVGINGTQPDGRIAKLVHAEVTKALTGSLEKNVPQVTQQLQQMARERAERELSKGAPQLEELANQQLQQIYQRTAHMVVNPPGGGMMPSISFDVTSVQVTPNGLLVDLQNGTQGSAPVSTNVRLKPGQVAMGVDLKVLNAQLAKVDFQPMLEQARAKADLLRLEFGKDARGNEIRPHLEMVNGRLTVSAEVIAHLKGVKPIKGATGLIKGGTGALDSGMGQLQKGMKKHAGGVGEVVGGILRAPFFLVDKVAEGGKAVIDHTVGAVVDTVPDVATRPTVRTRISIPLNVGAQDGVLRAELDGHGVEFKNAQSKAPFDLLDILPTRILSNLIVNGVADAQGPSKIGQQVDAKGVQLDLSQSLGVRFEDAQVSPNGEVTVVGRITPRTAQWAGDKLK